MEFRVQKKIQNKLKPEFTGKFTRCPEYKGDIAANNL
jgi:hypothetical protein